LIICLQKVIDKCRYINADTYFAIRRQSKCDASLWGITTYVIVLHRRLLAKITLFFLVIGKDKIQKEIKFGAKDIVGFNLCTNDLKTALVVKIKLKATYLRDLRLKILDR
jgi:hypothetical protein